MSRAAVDDLRDRLYVLQCAIDDARHDIADPSPSASILRAALETVLVAADSVATAPWGHDVPDPA